jgi:hypothetical protein
METALCRLTIVYPPASEEALVSVMLSGPRPLHGFTTWRGAGHGFSFEDASHIERVGGQVARNVLTSILPRSDADIVLERIREKAPIPHLMYWLEAVIAAGRLQ